MTFGTQKGKDDIMIRLAMGLLGLGFLLGVSGCNQSQQGAGKQAAMFQLHRKDRTGLDFENVLSQSSEFNVFNYMYFFNGGGVAAGDFNQDSLIDLYFTSNMGPNKLFLNRGNLRFEDVTDQANVAGQGGWTAGVTVVDINHDGLLDLYVSQMGEYQNIKGQNQLYVCTGIQEGVPRYEDQAYQYGLNLVGFGTQATFFDYDLDGDLDMFQLNHSLHRNGTFGQRKVFQDQGQHPRAGDRLFRNDAGTFTEVTEEAGIYSHVIGYGLGIATGDINQDGWPDIYIGNDFHENDYLYINQQDGTFKEELTQHIQHTSRFSMGVDIADINNDGQTEIISLDMLPNDPAILKASLGEDTYGIFQFKLGYGYNYQFSRNTLQLNNGDGSFSEIGMFADVHATDWSWAPLFFDMDHDGYKDLFISNGIPRRMNDIDYVNFRKDHDVRFKANTNNLEEIDLVFVDSMPQIKLFNRFFRNTHDLRFADMDAAIEGAVTSYSNGALLADLDNDGDLDVVVNNIEDEPFIYENIHEPKPDQHFLQLDLTGPETNPLAIGARAIVFKGESQLTYEHFLTKGYQSSMAPGLHLGLGSQQDIDSIVLIWPDRTYQRLDPADIDKRIAIKWEAGLPLFEFERLVPPQANEILAVDITAQTGLDFVHDENPFVEFNREILIPHMVSAEGPALAVGDANGDGLDDVFLGGAKRRRSALYIQQANGQFVNQTPLAMVNDSLFEDVDAQWADLDGDRDLDLIVASGGNEFWGDHPTRRQRVYINEGAGQFSMNDQLFPEALMTAACVEVADMDQDGDQDVFLGARAEVWNYGMIPTSYLYENQGNGQFQLVTDQRAAGLAKVGLVKSANWSDLDQNGFPDLILAMEWGPITVFLNDGKSLRSTALFTEKGWWNMAKVHDFDGDGDLDMLAGNTGMNAKFKPTQDEPLRLYVADFDQNDKLDQVLTYYLGGREVPFANYAEITKQLPQVKNDFLYARDFAAASPARIFGAEAIQKAPVLTVDCLHSIYYEQTSPMTFEARVLPDALQLSPQVQAVMVDVDQDGKQEALMGGNFYQCNIEMGRYDADFGHLFGVGEDGSFTVSDIGNLNLTGEVRQIAPITIGDKSCVIVAKNEAPVQVIQLGE